MDAKERESKGFYSDRSLDRAIEERDRRKFKLNNAFVSTEGQLSPRPFCQGCARYMVYIKNQGFECPSCFSQFQDESEDPDRVKSKYQSGPPIIMPIGKVNKKKQDRSDFPKGAHIHKDEETSSTGGSKVLIEDSKDVL